MTSTARFDNWQNRLGTQAGSIDASGNVTFDNDVTVDGSLDVGGSLNLGGASVGTWTSFTPEFFGMDAATISDATISFHYAQINDVLIINGQFTFGSTVNVTGEINFRTPIDCVSNGSVSGFAFEAGAGGRNLAPWLDTGYIPSRVRLWTMQTNVTYGILVQTSSTIPFTWGTGDYFLITAIGKVA